MEYVWIELALLKQTKDTYTILKLSMQHVLSFETQFPFETSLHCLIAIKVKNINLTNVKIMVEDFRGHIKCKWRIMELNNEFAVC